MSLSLRAAVMFRLTELLETVSVADGYVNNLQGRVRRGVKLSTAPEDGKPVVALLEPPVPSDPLGQGTVQSTVQRHSDWGVLIQAIAADDLDNPTDKLYDLLADIRRVLAEETRRASKGGGHNGFLQMGRSVTGVKIGTGFVVPTDKGAGATAFCYQDIYFTMEENLIAPYAWSQD